MVKTYMIKMKLVNILPFNFIFGVDIINLKSNIFFYSIHLYHSLLWKKCVKYVWSIKSVQCSCPVHIWSRVIIMLYIQKVVPFVNYNKPRSRVIIMLYIQKVVPFVNYNKPKILLICLFMKYLG
uniref:Uncharacterized protein n=1 Tax=Litopenaeus vannamei majanivirus Nimav-1_LVa TaxID=2984273 RepID=A0A9C7F035_9VIRU|nr:MAG: hypothetical protein [Litopenaeus vannamei majanivirus Nimav-1_LVa]